MKPLTTNTALDSFLQAVVVTDAQRRSQVTNEQHHMDMRNGSERSECCDARVNHDGLHTYCDCCGEPCKIR